MNIDVILFDWGGTLSQVVRQEEHIRRGMEKAARLLCDPWQGKAFDDLLGRVALMDKNAAGDPELREGDFSDVLLEWLQDFELCVESATLKSAVDMIAEEWIGSLDPFPRSAETLRQLQERGYLIGVVSNCMMPPNACLREFERNGFEGLADFLIFSSDVGFRKPSLQIYEAALTQAYPQGRPEDLSRVLFVGDSPVFDVAAPRAMGMKTALVSCQKGIWSPADYSKANPDFRIDSVAELLDIVGRA